MRLKIVQVGEPALRTPARPLTRDEITTDDITRLITDMRETMYDAPGVGLAAPQVGVPLQLAVIEDREDFLKAIPPSELEEKERRPSRSTSSSTPKSNSSATTPSNSSKAASASPASPPLSRDLARSASPTGTNTPKRNPSSPPAGTLASSSMKSITFTARSTSTK